MKDLSNLVGKTIQLLHMGNDPITGKPDPHPIPVGTKGKVKKIDNVQGTNVIDVLWENGCGLNLIDEIDTYIVI